MYINFLRNLAIEFEKYCTFVILAILYRIVCEGIKLKLYIACKKSINYFIGLYESSFAKPDGYFKR